MLENVWDTMLGEYVLSTGINRPKGYYSLEESYTRYFDLNPYGNQLSLFDPWISKKTRNEISKKEDEDPFTSGEIFYGATDIIAAYKLYEAQYIRLEEQELLKTMKLENEFVLVLGDMELNGMPINTSEWLELAEWSKARLIECENILRDQYPEVKN